MFVMPPTPPAIVQYLNLPQAAVPQQAAQQQSVQQPGTVSRNTPTAGFNDYSQYDHGWAPAVAMNNKFVIEVHQSEGANTLWYHVGQLQFSSGQQNVIHWLSSSATQYDNGATPAIALNNKNEVLEVHGASSGGGIAPVALYYRRGHLAGSSIVWDTPSIEFAAGLAPSAAINDNSEAVVVYGQGTSLYYMAGTISLPQAKSPSGAAPPSLPFPTFSKPGRYDNGVTPRVAINNAGVVIEVHQSEGAKTLWYHTGRITTQGASRDVSWSDSTQYDNGVTPNIALNNENHVMEIHQSDGQQALYIHRGTVNAITLPGNPALWGIHWDNALWVNPDHSADVASLLKGHYGVSPGVAINDDLQGGAPQERVIIVYRIDTNLYWQYSVWSAL